MLWIAMSCIAAACAGSHSSTSLSISISMDKLSFSTAWSKGGAAPKQQSVTISFTGDELVVGSPPDMPRPAWLSIQLLGAPGTGELPRSATILITADPSTKSAGRYSTVLRFVTSKGKDVVFKDLPVELVIADTLTLSPSKGSDTVIGGTVGTQQFSNMVSVDVTSSQASWQATIDQPWLSVSPSSGNGSQTLTINAIPNQLPGGLHPATLTVASADHQLSATLTVTLAVDGPRWWPARPVVGFVATNNLTNLSETIDLGANVDVGTLGLTAHSDAAWLTASVAGSQLTLTADPTGVPDGLHLGSVMLTSAQAGDPPPAVRVSLYKLGATINAQDQLVTSADAGAAPGMAIDPLRPRIYVGATAPLLIEGYDLYTGAKLLSTVPPQPNQRVWQISRDGRHLLTRQWTVNSMNGIADWGPTVIPFDLDSETWLAPSQANRSADDPQYMLGGIQLSRFNQFADGDGQPYQEIGGYQPPPLTQVWRTFADPVGNKWFVLTTKNDSVSNNSIVALDVQVYQLARKIVYSGLQTGMLPPQLVNTYDFTNQGHRIWFGYGWIDHDPAVGFGSVHKLPQVLTMPGGNPADPEEFSMNERGESMFLWFGSSPQSSVDYVIAHYDTNGALVRSDDYNGSAAFVGHFGSSPRTPDGLRWVTSLGPASPGVLRQITNQ